MNKIAISLIALAALSTASFASDRNDDLRQSGILKSGYGAELNNSPASAYSLAIVGKHTGSGTAFELATQNAEASVRSTDNH